MRDEEGDRDRDRDRGREEPKNRFQDKLINPQSLLPNPQSLAPSLWSRLLKFAFRLLYNEMAWSYDLVSWLVSFGRWRAWQEASLEFVAGTRVLEIAHGPGHMLLALHGRGYEVIGLDLSPRMGRQARRRLRQRGLESAVPLLRTRVQALPFANKQFDTILSQFPTDFILQPETLSGIHRILAEGGRLVILPEGRLTRTGPLYRFIDWLFRITDQRPPPGGEAAVWNRFEAALQTNGFETKVHLIELKGSEATVVIGVKA